MAAQDQVLPSVDNLELPPAPSAGFSADGIEDIVVFAGPAAAGPYTPRLFGASDIDGLLAVYKTGPAVKEAIYAMNKVAKEVVFLRLPTAAIAATHSEFTITSATLAGFGALSGTALDGADVVITCTITGTTGASFSYTLSTDGGVTTGAPVAQGVGLTIVVLGVTLTLTTGKVITAGNTIAWLQLPASSTVLPVTTSGTGTALASATITGSPNDTYEIAWKTTVGGVVGVSGIKGVYSLDYGAEEPTWSTETSLGSATTFLFLDGPNGVESTGCTLTLTGTDTLVVGDIIAANTTGPQYDSAGVTSGLAALRKGKVEWTWIRLVGPVTQALGATVHGLVSAWGNTSRPSWAVVDGRDRGTYETLAAWSARHDVEWTPYQSTYVGYTKGLARITCPTTGRSSRRSAMAVCTPRAMAYPIFVDWAEFDLNALAPDVTITDVNGITVEYDANDDPGGVKQGAIALRTWPRTIGVYPAKACLPGPPGNIKRIPVRRVFNVGEQIFFAVLQSKAVKDFRVAKAGPNGEPPPKPEVAGQLYKSDQAAFNLLGQTALERGIVEQGLATSVRFAINPTPISLGGDSYKLKASFGLNAFIYVDVLSGTSQLV